MFHISLESLERKVWKNRERIFDKTKFSSITISNLGYDLFQYLYEKNKETFIGEEFIIRGGKPVGLTRALKIDIAFWNSYKKRNQSKNPNISVDIPKEVSDFLDNHFYQTGLFHEKMKMYCEFRDTFVHDLEILSALEAKIQDKKYSQYYEYYGTSGCRARSYRELDLYKGLKDATKDDDLRNEILSVFKEGNKYSMSEIKLVLDQFHQNLNISRKAKATDLSTYFKLTKTKVTLPDGKIVNGFKLEAL